MSFKRVGDDFTALRVQKRQRVSDLLVEDIPEDEAKLLKNGRFACMVCKHCPVFDTVAVLSIHRQGKKHLANAKVRLEKLREDAELRQKREHMQYLNAIQENPNETEKAPLLKITQQQTKSALRGSQCSRTNRCANQERKPNLPFFQSRKPVYTKTNNTQTWETGAELSNEVGANSHVVGDTIAFPSNSRGSETTGNKSTGSSQIPSISNLSKQVSSELISRAPNQLTQRSSDLLNSHQHQRELSPDERARREHFSRLRQAGWIMGSDGKWCKDENAEFDSDEDEPPLPP